MDFKRVAALSLLSFIALATILSKRAQTSAPVAQRRAAFNNLLEEQWQYTMQESPEFATIVGDYRYNDRWSDGSLAHIAQQNEDAKKFLGRFEAIDTTGFS